MPKAERGTPKDLANRMKSKGLQKLAFYCQVCEKQMRDQNGFKQHCSSEPHVRMMLMVGQNAGKVIGNYSRQFKHDFLQLLRTSHGEKRVHANQFYQEYISHKSHIHMNGTHWKTLTEFVKGLGREGICRVDEGERGLYVAYIDTTPEALKRQAEAKKRERQDKGEEERANLLIAEQIARANKDLQSKDDEAVQPLSLLDKRPEMKMKISLTKPSTEIKQENISQNTKKLSIFAQQRKEIPQTQSVNALKRPLSNAEQIVQEAQERKRRAEQRKTMEDQRRERSVY